jgi:hypothetical protein
VFFTYLSDLQLFYKIEYLQYRKGRGREGPKEFLKNFQGAIQADGWQVDEKFEKREGIILPGCLTHVRRKFEEALGNDKVRAEHA